MLKKKWLRQTKNQAFGDEQIYFRIRNSLWLIGQHRLLAFSVPNYLFDFRCLRFVHYILAVISYLPNPTLHLLPPLASSSLMLRPPLRRPFLRCLLPPSWPLVALASRTPHRPRVFSAPLRALPCICCLLAPWSASGCSLRENLK
jgi:hypothetical protein